MVDDLFSKAPALYFEIEGQRLYLPYESIETAYQKRVPKHRRLYRDGARLESLGMVEEVYMIRGSLYNENEDPAILEQGIPPYPDLANKFVELARVQMTGDLMHPRQGLIRAVIEQFTLREGTEERAASTYEARFVQDNEDGSEVASMKPAGPRGAFVKLQETVAALERAGWIADMDEVLDRVEGVLGGSATDSLLSSYFGGGGGDLFAAGSDLSLTFETYEPVASGSGSAPASVGDPGHPREHWLMRVVQQLMEAVRNAREDARRAQKQRRSIVYAQPTSLFAVATATRNDVDALIAANPDVDPFDIPAGTIVYVEQKTPPGFDARAAR